MNYFNDVLTTFLGLECSRSIAVYAGSENSFLDLIQNYFILTHLQESTKNTSLPSLFDPLTLALSILILFFKKTCPF